MDFSDFGIPPDRSELPLAYLVFQRVQEARESLRLYQYAEANMSQLSASSRADGWGEAGRHEFERMKTLHRIARRNFIGSVSMVEHAVIALGKFNTAYDFTAWLADYRSAFPDVGDIRDSDEHMDERVFKLAYNKTFVSPDLVTNDNRTMSGDLLLEITSDGTYFQPVINRKGEVRMGSVVIDSAALEKFEALVAAWVKSLPWTRW